MASSISHEITQPLTAVRTNAEVAQELLAGPEPDLEEVRSALTDIVSDSHRMSELLQNIRELFGNRKREKEQVDVNDVALKTLQIEDGELAKQFRSQANSEHAPGGADEPSAARIHRRAWWRGRSRVGHPGPKPVQKYRVQSW